MVITIEDYQRDVQFFFDKWVQAELKFISEQHPAVERLLLADLKDDINDLIQQFPFIKYNGI